MRRLNLLLVLTLLVGLLAAWTVPESAQQSAAALAEAAEQAAVPETAAAAPMAAKVQAPEYAGTYSAQLPAADSPGRAVTLTLAEDGSATMATDYQNGRRPVVEIGTWEANPEGTATVTLAAQGKRKYFEPLVIVFQLEGNTLTSVAYDTNLYGQEGLTLTRAEPEAAATAAGPTAAPVEAAPTEPTAVPVEAPAPEVDYAGTYTAGLPAADSPGREITLTLAEDGSATMATDYLNDQPPVVETGSWQANPDGTATVTLTGQAGEEYAEPVVIVFQLEGETLSAVEYDASLYGSEGLTFTRVEPEAAAAPAEAAGEPAPIEISPANTYLTVRPAASGSSQLLVLQLREDNSALFGTESMGDDPTVVESGTWQDNGDGTVTVVLSGTQDQQYEEPVELTFQRDGDLLQLVGSEERFGTAGLSLRLAADVARDIKASLVTLDLEAGFPLDPTFVSVQAGGPVDSSLLRQDCKGFINQYPVVTVNWTGTAPFVKAFFLSDSDTTMLVVTPDGQTLCNDDANENLLDPVIEIENPMSGEYHIWVGSYAKNQLVPGVLVLTANPELNIGTFDLGSLIRRPPLPEVKPAPAPISHTATLTETIKAQIAAAPALKAGSGPLTVDITATGDIPLFQLGLENEACNGLIAAVPDHILRWPAEGEALRIYFEGDADSTLLVVGPGGAVACSDDVEQGANINPLIALDNAPAGPYLIWVGRFNPDAPVTGQLTVTSDAAAVPAVLGPAQ